MSKTIYKMDVKYFTLCIPFILIFLIEYMTPMHSDDFVYYIKGNSFSAHLYHYLSWSGRFVSDYFSTLVLSSQSQILKSIVIAFILTTILFLVTKIGNSFTESSKFFPIQFLSLFFIYWVTNPTLGEIVFWFVGAANYLITNFFIVIFLYALIRYLSKRKGLFLLFAVSFFAGCSNENTTWIVLLLSLIASCYLFYREKNKILFIATLLVFLGFAVLIFSPGNFHRATLSSHYELSFLDKVWRFLSSKLPHALGKTWVPLLISLVLLTAYKGDKKSKNFYCSLLFIVLGLLSILSMVVSPSFPARALSGAHLFYIISCSFSISYILDAKKNKSMLTLLLVGFLALISFVFSYIQIVFSYNSVKVQDKIRNYEISKGLSVNEKISTIPEFYFPVTLRAGDSIDSFHNPDAMGQYYKQSYSINTYPIQYNYAIIINGEKLPIFNSKNTGISNIYMGKDSLLKGSSIAIQFDSINKFSPDNTIIVTTKKGKHYTYQNLEINSLYGINVIGFTVPVSLNQIDSISYQPEKGSNYTITLSEYIFN